MQHDHYVPAGDGQWLFIYRSGSANWGNEPAAAFGPEHDWLVQAVGVRLELAQQPAVIEGEVHDGTFECETSDPSDCFVFSGVELRAAIHRVCWEIAGRPDPWPLGEADSVRCGAVLQAAVRLRRPDG